MQTSSLLLEQGIVCGFTVCTQTHLNCGCGLLPLVNYNCVEASQGSKQMPYFSGYKFMNIIPIYGS